MGDAVFSAFLQVFFQTISDFAKNELQMERLIENERERLISKLDMIQAILRGAEKKAQLSESQKLLFSHLKEASYKGMEVLDEYFYEDQRQKVIHFADMRNNRMYSALNPLRMSFNHGMEKKIMDFACSIDRIKEIKEIYSAFQVDVQGHSGQHDEGSSLNPSTLLPPTVVCGRENDCDAIVDILLQPYLKSNVAVLPILGEPYIGKTTVAQEVLKVERVSMHFELKLWAHVSHNFNIERITSSIIESIEGVPFHRDNLSNLQVRLEKLLRGKRYLLVLDDYWSENWQDWDKLKRSFVSGARGSKIIVTTRSRKVAHFLGTSDPYKLQRLQDEDCWLLFCQCAQGTESYPHNCRDIQDQRLKEEVLLKCKGIPFIAASLGYSINLHQEKDRSKWGDILREEKWDSSTTDFDRALRLSYAQLDYHLRPCFAYSSIIPQKLQFEKEWLIQHWMAQGFIIPNSNRGETMEDMGRSYFSSLVSQSFFQRAHVDPTGQEHSYSLSETMHDLASRVSDADCKCYMMGESCNIPEKVQHLAVVFNNSHEDLFEVISCRKFLHTFIILGGSEDFVLRIPHDIGERFTRLRSLDLSDFGVTELPESIGKLKHLRCLQLQGTKIKFLPKSICDLYHLQTLGLKNCYCLEELPHELKKLRKLRHIDLVMSPNPHRNVIRLQGMPKDIGLLTDLQILSRFVVSRRRSIYSHRASIGELANLNNLQGKLIISDLHLVENSEEAAQARLDSKQFLQELELSWSNDNQKADKPGEHQKAPTFIELASRKISRKLDISSSSKNNGQAKQILEQLKAPTSIKKITLSGYNAMSCPDWLGSAHYKNLVSVSLYDFERCSDLPSLGLLPHLESLHLKGWDQLTSMNCGGFCGGSSFRGGELHKGSFCSLKKLHLERMERLQRWEGDEKCAFPSLVELVLENCCKLERVTHNLPSLIKITVKGLPKLCGLRDFPSLKYVNVNATGEWIWGSLSSLASPLSVTLCKLPAHHFPSGLGQFHKSLQQLEISDCEQLVSIPDDWPPCNLIHFSVKNCPQLYQLPGGIQHLRALENMEIIGCRNLSCLPEMNGLISLIRLEITGCGSIRSLPYTGCPSSMQVLSINNYPQLAASCKEGVDRAKMEKIFSVWINGIEMSTSAQH